MPVTTCPLHQSTAAGRKQGRSKKNRQSVNKCSKKPLATLLKRHFLLKWKVQESKTKRGLSSFILGSSLEPLFTATAEAGCPGASNSDTTRAKERPKGLSLLPEGMPQQGAGLKVELGLNPYILTWDAGVLRGQPHLHTDSPIGCQCDFTQVSDTKLPTG